jgi:hypothetical protein
MAFGTVLAAWTGEERAVASKVAMIALRRIASPLWAVASGRTVAERQCAVQANCDERRPFAVEAQCEQTNRDPPEQKRRGLSQHFVQKCVLAAGARQA